MEIGRTPLPLLTPGLSKVPEDMTANVVAILLLLLKFDGVDITSL